MKHCPTCGEPVEKIREESDIKKPDGKPLAINEWWCNRCQEYLYDEDFIYEE